MSTVIQVENISKLYRLGNVGSGTLKDDLGRWWQRVRGKEDPLMLAGAVNDRTRKAESDYVWALKDINFEVQQGDVLGIIGRNGAGKSTLLKILSKTTAPTTGSVKVKGRIASLLEVGTGFHPELTGRENIYLNGAILGMRKHEITRKLDEIIDFAGVERYIDTPVKRYSSGMYVRLAFGVAAHLESEILIIDEVLAVGDAEFQKKCLGKMGEVSKGEGRTVLFVSHNMIAMKGLCKQGLYLKNGTTELYSDIDTAITNYLKSSILKSYCNFEFECEKLKLISISSNNNGVEGNFNIDEPLYFSVECQLKCSNIQWNMNLFFKTTDGMLIFVSTSKPQILESGFFTFQCEVPSNIMNDNEYTIDLMVVENQETILTVQGECLNIKGVEPKREGAWLDKFPGIIRPTSFKWIVKKI